MKKAPTFVDAFLYSCHAEFSSASNYWITNFLVAVFPSSVTLTM